MFALFIGLFALANLVGELFVRGFDANIWWISFGAVPPWLCRPALAFAALGLIRFALGKPGSAKRSYLTFGVSSVLALVALINAVGFYRLWAIGRIAPGFPVPLSLLIVAGLLAVMRDAWSPREVAKPARGWVLLGGLSLLGAFPLGLMLFFGNTDYRRPADVIVVFGARAYADGRLSDALQDRIRTACELYRAGFARHLVLSGGPGDGAITEASAMRRYALEQGVRAEDLTLDDLGLNTEATVAEHGVAVERKEGFGGKPFLPFAAHQAGFSTSRNAGVHRPCAAASVAQAGPF